MIIQLHPKISGFGYSIRCGYPKLPQNNLKMLGFDTQKKNPTPKIFGCNFMSVWIFFYIIYTIIGYWVFLKLAYGRNGRLWSFEFLMVIALDIFIIPNFLVDLISISPTNLYDILPRS
jgi:hypothetical protein